MRRPAPEYDIHHDRALEMEFAEKLTERRRQLNVQAAFSRNSSYFSQRHIGQRVGCSHVSIHNYEEAGYYPRTFAQWQRWAKALGGELTIELKLPD